MYVYGAVRMEGFLAFACAISGSVGIVAYGMAVHSFTESNGKSGALLKYVSRTVSMEPTARRVLFSKIVDREIKSTRDPRIMAGSTFYFDKPLLLTIADILLVQSVNLLIMK